MHMQPGTPTTPGTPAKPIPSDLKEKVQALFKTAKDGVIKATDFNVEFQKKYGASRPWAAPLHFFAAVCEWEFGAVVCKWLC